MISAIILTRNEEKNIKECLRSLMWCTEIIVIDDYSTDGTIKEIEKLNTSEKKKIRIYERKLDDDFSGQRNYGLQKASNEWVLFVDADERVPNNLQKEIIDVLNKLKLEKSQINGFNFKRSDLFLGKKLRFGETGKVKLLRLARKKSGVWKRRVHEFWKVEGEVRELKTPILHYPHKSIFEFIEEINYYSDLHGRENKREGKTANLGRIIFYPLGKFFVYYFWKLGILDGVAGLTNATLMSFHSFLAWSKLWTH